MSQSRFGIPAMAHDECLTGFTAYGATIYPTSLGMAATFDPALIRRVGEAIGSDMAEAGVHQGLAPVVDVIRDYRWGRCEETFGEDPYLVGEMAEAYVRGVQSAGVVATLKHFAGYSASMGGRNHAPAQLGRRELFDVILPPFERLVAAGVGSVMNSYAEIDGEAPAASEWLLTSVLRDRWGFEGTVVSDYWSLPFLVNAHRVAADLPAAGALALRAGMDVELPDQRGFGEALVSAVEKGQVAESAVDRAVRRVLRQKIELGLLDPDWDPRPPAVRAGALDLDKPEHRRLAHAVARSSAVLLTNDGTLPLPPAGRIALIGPCADDVRTMFGCYSFPNHVLADRDDLGNGVEAVSLRTALSAELPGVEWQFVQGCPIRDEDRSGIPAAVEACSTADVAVLVVGDKAGMFGVGTSGEGCDVEDLRLPGVQEELVEAVLATKRPVVLVVSSGRPYAVGRFTADAAAMVQVFLPGEEGGRAVAELLAGTGNFSGKLPVQLPMSPAVSPTPTSTRRWATGRAGCPTSIRPPRSPSGTAFRTPPSRSTGWPSTVNRCLRTGSSPSPRRYGTRVTCPAPRRSSSTPSTRSPRSPGRFARCWPSPRSTSLPARAPRSASPCTPTGWPSPAWRGTVSSSPARSCCTWDRRVWTPRRAARSGSSARNGTRRSYDTTPCG